ncbi:MAG: FAD-dependent oxidoreductase [Pseudolabrys sp.]
MTDGINRRDFLNGVALTVASGLTPAAQLLAATSAPYPPALTGLRGHHPGSFEVAHKLRDGETFKLDGVPVSESYDLIVVGGGISGLAAAWFYRERAGRKARILVLDNHDDFGGHAKRNEFTVDGQFILGYGGSESLQSPKAEFSPIAKRLIRRLGIRVERFETAFDRKFYPTLGLSRAVFFPKETFGRDALVTGDPMTMVADDLTPELLNAKPLREFIAGFPVSGKSKAELIGLFEQKTDPLAGKSAADKIKLLKSTSYRDYLMKICGVGEEVANCFQGRTLDFFALGCDAVSAHAAMETGYPGFAGLGLPHEQNAELTEPYIYHFPDGNAAIARLLVRDLVPGVAKAKIKGMDDIVRAKFDYGALDRDGAPVRVRLNSTCINVKNQRLGAEIVYVRDGKVIRAGASHVVLACFNMAIPYMMPELSQDQRNALAMNVKAPLVYTNVVTRDWKPWAKLKVHEILAPMSFHCRVKLDYPVDLGGYRHPREPAKPICIHMVHVPGEPHQGLEARDQFRIGRQKLLDMSFEQIEKHIRDDLDRMLGAGGFSSGRDIAAITVNRWAHGYAYGENSLFDKPDEFLVNAALARRKAGHVAIANSDSEWSAYAHSAIDAANRAVNELLPKT